MTFEQLCGLCKTPGRPVVAVRLLGHKRVSVCAECKNMDTEFYREYRAKRRERVNELTRIRRRREKEAGMFDNLTNFDQEIVASVRRGKDTITKIAKNLQADSIDVAFRVQRMRTMGTLNVNHKGRLYVREASS